MRKTYKYIIELSKPVWPRHIVDELMYKTGKVRDAKLIVSNWEGQNPRL
jgi:hypothetical protein